MHGHGQAAGSYRSGILIGATLAVLGIGMSVGSDENLGSWLTLTGILVTAFSLHKVGRAGPL